MWRNSARGMGLAAAVIAWAMAMGIGIGAAQERKASAAETEVWGREELYWKLLKARDVAGYLALWDETFLGWPSDEKAPVGKDAFVKDPVGPADEPLLKYELERKGATPVGDAVTVFYLVRTTFGGKAAGKVYVYRITHTWKKSRGEWRIVSGMGCTAKADGTC